MNMRTLRLMVMAALPAPMVMGNLVVNPNFNQGANNLAGYEAYAFWQKGAASFSSAWALADAPVTANGGGTAVFRMNTQLAAADPFWDGATQVMTFQQNFWTPDNNAGVTPTINLYSQILTFTGKAVVTQPYAPGNQGIVFIQFLDKTWNAVALASVDVSTLPPSGEFSITVATPSTGLNIIQIGARNTGIEGTAGEVTLSQFNLTSRSLAPVGVDVAISGSDVALSFPSVGGVNYAVEYSYDLSGWTPYVAPATPGTGGVVTITIPGAAPAAGNEIFGRVVATSAN